MKMPDCFEAYRPLALIVATLILAGCDSGVSTGGGGGGGCASSFSQPSGFEQEFDTFTIGETTNENPVGADLDKTLFRQFFKAARPADSASKAQKLYEFMVSESDAFTDFNPDFVDEPIQKDSDDKPIEYESVRNGFDLFEAMIIASDQFDSLQTARDAMASCARDTHDALPDGDPEPGSIAVSNITVTETEKDDPESWSFQVNYANNPEPLDFATPFGPNIGRVLFTPDSFVRTLYDYEAFIGSGAASDFKQPAVLVAGFNASLNETLDSEGDDEETEKPSVVFESFPLEETEDDRGQERGETDRWSWSSEEGTLAFTEAKDDVPDRCIRVTVDYAGQDRLNVQFSKDRCPLITGTEDFNEDRDLSYTPNNPNIAQTR